MSKTIKNLIYFRAAGLYLFVASTSENMTSRVIESETRWKKRLATCLAMRGSSSSEIARRTSFDDIRIALGHTQALAVIQLLTGN